jgi:type 2 lantibiotic biosynthesis protein LanM
VSKVVALARSSASTQSRRETPPREALCALSQVADEQVLFLERLFPVRYSKKAANLPAVIGWVEKAESLLAVQAGPAYSSLPDRPQADLKQALARFLEQLLLLDPPVETLNMAVEFWAEAQAEFLWRLEEDRAEIEKVFGRRSCGPVAAIATDLSDRHNHGRSVAAVTFESGLKLVYKPRNTGIEAWHFRLLGRLNKAGAPFQFRALNVLPGTGYGWIEFAEHNVCRSHAARSSYYRNAGAMLCILHVLRARDCHFQNLVASGVHPVLVDAETLFQPQRSGDPEFGSVTDTGLIPCWRPGPSGHIYDVSALGCITPRTTPFRIARWTPSGMRLKPALLTPKANIPFAPQSMETPLSYVSEIAQGFSETYRFLMHHRRDLIAQACSAAKEQIRYVIRDTLEYYRSLNRIPFATSDVTLPTLPGSHTVFEPLSEAELRSLGNLDIPRFTLATSSCSLAGVEGCFRLSGLEAVCAGIEALCEEDLKKQLKILDLSWNLFRAADLLSANRKSQ